MKKYRNPNWRKIFPFAAVSTAFSVFSCNDDPPIPILPMAEPNIVEVAASNNEFSTLVAAVQTAGLADTLSGPGPFTVFAPTNAAFDSFLSDTGRSAEDLLESEDLDSILTYHVLGARISASAVASGRVKTAADAPLFISVAPDESIWINGNTRIVETDMGASNGVIHVLDYVIMSPKNNIAAIVVAAAESEAPQFTQWTAALIRADLNGEFSGGFDDDLTVFVPTDAAFEALYQSLGVSGVDEIDVETLTNVLLHHVVPARVFFQDLKEGAELPTLLEGITLTVDLANLQINESGLVTDLLNIHATNGVIHAIDSVLLPE